MNYFFRCSFSFSVSRGSISLTPFSSIINMIWWALMVAFCIPFCCWFFAYVFVILHFFWSFSSTVPTLLISARAPNHSCTNCLLSIFLGVMEFLVILWVHDFIAKVRMRFLLLAFGAFQELSPYFLIQWCDRHRTRSVFSIPKWIVVGVMLNMKILCYILLL